MMRLAALSLTAAVLAGCSSSSRVEGVVPGWANSRTGSVEPDRSRAAVRATPDAAAASQAAAPAPQAAAKPQPAPGEE
jgi:uncharacterized lipoprotein